MIKLIIFDWDDVLTIGSKEGYFKCYHETLVDLNIELNPDEERRMILSKWSKPHREALRELLKENPHLLDKACELYEKKLFGDVFVSELSVIEGTIKLLERLQKNYILCVATGAHPKFLKERIMPKFGFPDVFSQVISTYDIDDVQKHKPHPYMINAILKTQNIKPTEAIMIGDAKSDVLMAKEAGVTPVVVLTGNLDENEAKKMNVKYIIENIVQIEKIMALLSH